MKKLLPLFFAIATVAFFSCEKELSLENGGNVTNDNIIGADCRITKIVYADSATGIGKASLTAIINSSNKTTDVTVFDSLTATIDYNSVPVYIGDTIHINADEYFVLDAATLRVNKFHGLIDPTNPFSPQFDAVYTYNASGYLLGKTYSAPLINFGIPYLAVGYTYLGGNLTGMTEIDLTTGNLNKDAQLTYYNTNSPKNFLYLFTDEDDYAEYTQFLNFGIRSTNAVQNYKVRYYNPGNILSDSSVSTFSSYTKSIDNYVTSVIMKGDDQPSIPAVASKLKFSYKCK
jgi:hypothetical protein